MGSESSTKTMSAALEETIEQFRTWLKEERDWRPRLWSGFLSGIRYVVPSKRVLILLVALLLFAHYVHKPVPAGVMGKDRPTIQLLSNVYRLFGISTKICRLLGSTSCLVNAMRFQTKAWLWVAPNPRSPDIEMEDTIIAGVPVRIYAPVPDFRLGNGVLVYAHGGGWFLGDLDLCHAETHEVAQRIRKVVVSVDYRMSPEHPFPAPLDDFEKVVRVVLNSRNVSRWSIDPHQVAIAGVSSGGNLAAATAQRLLAKPESIDVKLPSYKQGHAYIDTGMLNPQQMAEVFLIYLGLPITHADVLLANAHIHSEVESHSSYSFIDHSVLPSHFHQSPINTSCPANDVTDMLTDWIPIDWSTDNPETPSASEEKATLESSIKKLDDDLDPDEIENVKHKLRHYLLNPDLSPIFSPKLTGLPATYLITAGYDVLRDECAIYADRLYKAGVPVEWRHYESANHGVFSIFSLELGEKMLDDFAHFAKSNLK